MDILVSVVVITFNSAKYIIETLESIKSQTYSHLEIIISDDGSIDNTCEIVNNWLEKNSAMFIRTQLIKNVNGTNSISANCNRGLRAAKGKYIKFIAGDDILLPNCIEDNLIFAEKEKAAFVFSLCQLFTNDKKNHDHLKYLILCQNRNMRYFKLDAEQQYRALLRKNFVMAPSAFINKDILNSLGGFDEKYFIEDYPLWIKATKNRQKLYFLNKFTVRYRLSDDSCSNTLSSKNNFLNKRYIIDH